MWSIKHGGHIVSNKRDTNVDQVPVPTNDHVRNSLGGNDFNERSFEELVAVEEEVVEEPASGGSDKSAAKVAGDQFERLDIVTGLVDTAVPLGSGKSRGAVHLFVVTVVGQVEGQDGHDGKGHSESPLGRHLGVRWVCTVMEDEKEDDEHTLVEQLTPPLHEESEDDVFGHGGACHRSASCLQ